MNFEDFFWPLQFFLTFPKQKIKIRQKSFNVSPWVTKGLVKSSKKKRRLYENFFKKKEP